ncbi:terpene synthase-like [Xylocopa sonorina]|uniref:terpene synthase-like n=1 Tax=Xylocopa sonorina TaxID=1818115 RepID=UPI00403ADF5D
MLQVQDLNLSDVIRLSKAAYTEEEKELLDAYYHTIQVPSFGKALNTRLPKILNHWLKIPQDKVNIIEDIARLMLASNLLMEDIRNDANLRDGMPVAHKVFGIPSTLNAVYYVFSISVKRVRQLNNPEAVRIFSNCCIEVDCGIGMHIYWKDNYICPTEMEFKVAAVQKCAVFSMIVSMMQLFSDYKKDLTILIGILALYSQIRSDYLDFYAKEVNLTLDILKQRPKDIAMHQYFVTLLEKYGTYAYTRALLDELDKKAREEIKHLGGNPMFDELLDELQSWKN